MRNNNSDGLTPLFPLGQQVRVKVNRFVKLVQKRFIFKAPGNVMEHSEARERCMTNSANIPETIEKLFQRLEHRYLDLTITLLLRFIKKRLPKVIIKFFNHQGIYSTASLNYFYSFGCLSFCIHFCCLFMSNLP